MPARVGQETTAQLAKFGGDAHLILSQLHQEISVLNSNTDRVVQSVQEAEIAKAEQAGSITVAEQAIMPRSPVEIGGASSGSAWVR